MFLKRYCVTKFGMYFGHLLGSGTKTLQLEIFWTFLFQKGTVLQGFGGVICFVWGPKSNNACEIHPNNLANRFKPQQTPERLRFEWPNAETHGNARDMNENLT